MWVHITYIMFILLQAKKNQWSLYFLSGTNTYRWNLHFFSGSKKALVEFIK